MPRANRRGGGIAQHENAPVSEGLIKALEELTAYETALAQQTAARAKAINDRAMLVSA